MTDYSQMTDEEFDLELSEIINEDCVAYDLLQIPGIYEILSEHFHNEVLDRWEQKRQDDERYENMLTESDDD